VFAGIFLAFLLANLKLRAFLGNPLPVLGQVSDFTLTNQLGRAVSLADLRGHVWVADIIFTRCAGPCLKMSKQMKELQESLPAASKAQLISLTTDPAFDTPAVLKAYGERFAANPGRWMFLTGSKQEVGHLATNSLKLAGIEKKPEERESAVDLFIHSTIFVIVDKSAQLRGVFQTTGEDIDPLKVKKEIQAAIRRLEREP
jgi:cytochrome oxidase Cu insertion factor (SCO1/SenC/PrrC family)